MSSVDDLRRNFMPAKGGPRPEPGPAIAPDHDDVIALRFRVSQMDDTLRRLVDAELKRSVRWLGDAMRGVVGIGKRRRFAVGHPDLLGLFKRLALRCQAHDDRESERELIEIAVAFKDLLK